MATGRSSKLTPGIAKVLIEARRLGLSDQHAANYAGVNVQTFIVWKRKGEEDILRKRSSRYRSLVEDYQRAEGKRVHDSLEKIKKAGDGGVIERVTTITTNPDGSKTETTRERVVPGTWQAHAWMLERMHPNDFALRTKSEISGPDGGPVQVNTLMDLVRMADADEKALEKSQQGKG